MSNHHKTSQNNVTWCYLFNLRYGCKKANHSTLCSGLVGLLRILVICTDAAGCTDAGLVKHFLFKPWTNGPAMTSNTQQYLINPIYILLHPFTSVLDNVSENIRKLFQHSTRRSKGSQQSPTLAMGSRPEQTLHELTRWLRMAFWFLSKNKGPDNPTCQGFMYLSLMWTSGRCEKWGVRSGRVMSGVRSGAVMSSDVISEVWEVVWEVELWWVGMW